MTTPTATNTTTPKTRASYNDEAFGRAMLLAENLLADVPELEAVAVIPSWGIPNERLPVGIIMGRTGPLRSPAEIMHMAIQLHACMKQQLDNLVSVMGQLDGMAAKLARTIAEKQKELHALDAELVARRADA